MKKIFLLLLLTTLPLSAVFAQTSGGKYHNPVIPTSLPDPSVVRANDGYFYLYATEDIRNLPIYRSCNLVDWEFVGTAFTNRTRPQWNRKGNLWAPDINFVDGHYVLYYAKSEWGGQWTCGVGVATADHPQGPFTDHGALFISKDIGVQNSIDPFFIEEGGHKYVFWGSFHGIFGIELTADGLHVKSGDKPRKVAGTFMEATYIHKRGDYYYLFGSAGTCCEGIRSTYRITYGRSRNLFGPYVDKQGQKLLNNHFDVLIHKSDSVVGPGHNAEFVMDDAGNDWIIYHGFRVKDPDAGRQIYMDRVDWVDDWPIVKGDQPSVESDKPALSPLYLADPTIFVDRDTYYLYGTSPHSDTGFQVYTSADLKSWSAPVGKITGYALCGGTFGTAGFWAPQVFKHGGRYYMAYTANEQIAVATADSPLGPFRQDKPAMIPAMTKEIDPFVFFDTDGKAYLYHVRLQKGNRIFVSELNSDLLSVKEETTRECLSAIPGSWEDTARAAWTVTEGPTVTKIGDTYYLFYSCNDFRNINYAVGYATAKSPLGPWKKQKKPLISRDLVGENGTGHGDLFRNAQGEWQYVFHTHHSNSTVSPRRTALITLKMKGKKFVADKNSFRYLSR